MSPRKLQNEIKQDFRADGSVWSSYKDLIVSEFAQINYQDLSDHLLREFNRKIINLGLSGDLMFAPFDSGFRFLGDTIASDAGPEAAYVAALTAAGATVTAPQQAALSTFISGEIAAGRWDGIKRLYFPVWGTAAANAICMKSCTVGTFIGSIDHGAGYAKPSNSSSGMRTNTSLPDIGVTKESWHFAALFQEFGLSDGAIWGRDINADFGALADFQSVEIDGDNFDVYANTIFRVSNRTHISNNAIPVLFSIFGTANTVNIKNRNSNSVGSVYSSSIGGSTNTVDFVDGNFIVMASQFNDNPHLAFLAKYGAFSFGNTMSDAQDTAYTLALKTLYETVTNLTLP